MPTSPEPYYVPLGDGRYESTIHAQGAWNPHEQHMAPVSGLLVHELDRFQPRPELRMARIGFDILGLIPAGEFEIVTTVLRAGRSIELVQAELIAGGRVAVRATAWRLLRSDTSAIAGIEDERMPGRSDASGPLDLSHWPGGYIRSLEVRSLPEHAPGRGRVWLRPLHPLLADVRFSDVARLVGVTDTANGIAARVSPGSYAFPNVDLQLHLYREPTGEWLGIANSVSFGSDGIGLTSSVLHDDAGPFGRAEQILTIRKL